MLLALPLLLLLTPAPAAPQGEPQGELAVPLQRVTPIDWRRPETNLTVEQADGRIRRVSWQPAGAAVPKVIIPLRNPVTDLEAALLPSGDGLVLLAGGVREGESLDLYVADKTSRVYAFETNGGSQLSQDFAHDLGSWPVVDGNDLLLFAYLRQGMIEFRAVDLSWSDPHREKASPLAQRTLPATGGNGEAVRGFTAVSDLASNQVHVSFDGAGQPIDFPHPLAPRLQLQQMLLDFGRLELGGARERVLQVGNTGKRPLRLSLAAYEPFAIEGDLVRNIEPGGEIGIHLQFRPQVAQAFQERLQLISNASNPTLTVPLRGTGFDPAAAVAAPVPAPEPQPAATVSSEAPPAPPPPPPKMASAPTVLSCTAVHIDSDGAGRVRVTGIANAAGPGIDLVVRSGDDGEAHTSASASGAFQVSLPAAAGAALQITAVGEDGSRSQTLELGYVLPRLQRGDGYLELRGPAGKAFVLFAVELGADGEAIERVGPAWRGSLGSLGSRRIALEAFGPTPPTAVVAVVDPAGSPRRSNVAKLR